MKSEFSRYILFGSSEIAFTLYIYLVLSLVTVSSVRLSLLSFVLIGAGVLYFRTLLIKLSGQKSKSRKFKAAFYGTFGISAIVALFII